MARASAPGKILLAGEYAILEGGPAVVMAVDRRARAWIEAAAPTKAPSPFLAAAAHVLADHLGPDSAAARAAVTVRVDSDALRAPSGEKLGLGSSAAATVAALGACLGAGGPPGGPLDRALLHRLAHRAHGDAQAALDPSARGSGADVAASVWGGVLHLEPRPDQPPSVAPLRLPDGLDLVAVWTGRPADTRALVAAIRALSGRDPDAYRRCLDAIAGAAAALIAACRSSSSAAAVDALAAGGEAARELGRAAGVELVLESYRELARSAASFGGALKPTGAGGGDIALAAFSDADAALQFRAHASGLGMHLPDLRVEVVGALLEDDSA
jgi:phosphomevalonate kinase